MVQKYGFPKTLLMFNGKTLSVITKDNDVHCKNALIPIVVIELGSVIEVNAEQ